MFAGNDPVNYADPSGLSLQGYPVAKPSNVGNPFVNAANLLYQGAKALAPHVGSAINYASQAASSFVNQAIEARMVTTWASHESIVTPSGRSYPGGLSRGRNFDNATYQDKLAAYRHEIPLVNQVYGSSFRDEMSIEDAVFNQAEIRNYLADSKERGYQDWLQRQPTTWDKVKLWDNDVVARNVANQIDQGASIWKAVYVGAGTAIADNVGVSALEDARSGRDFHGNRLSMEDRVMRGAFGTVQLAGTAVGLKAPVTRVGTNLGQGVKNLATTSSKTLGLVHLTDEAGQAGIRGNQQIIGRHGIFAVPESVAGESTALKVLRTGLTPSRTTQNVPIPHAATTLFKRPVPIGPYSAWKYLGGVRYASPGSINTATGAFTSSSTIVGPNMLIYGPDIVVHGSLGATGAAYWYGSSGQKKPEQ